MDVVGSLAINGLLFMVSVGFNAAARSVVFYLDYTCFEVRFQLLSKMLWCWSVRVSNELGAGNPKSAEFSVVVVNLVSFIIAVIEAIIIMALRNVISYVFTGGETVANAVSELCPYLAISLILNGIQPVLSGNNSIIFNFKGSL